MFFLTNFAYLGLYPAYTFFRPFQSDPYTWSKKLTKNRGDTSDNLRHLKAQSPHFSNLKKWDFFLGGGAGRFEGWSISSHIRVQITSESVRSIALIGLNMFSTHNAFDKPLKIFYGLDLEGPSSKNG